MINKTCQSLNLASLRSGSIKTCIFSTQRFCSSLPKCCCCVLIIYFVSCSKIFLTVGPLIVCTDMFRLLIKRTAFSMHHFAMSIKHTICSGSLVFIYIFVAVVFFYMKVELSTFHMRAHTHTHTHTP